MEVFVARQPVLDEWRRVHGYELLYRACAENSFPGIDGHTATSHVIRNSLLSVGTENLLNNRRGYVNFSRESLLAGLPLLLDSRRFVIELLETVRCDDEVAAALSRLHASGFQIALDDVSIQASNVDLVPYAQILKVDFQACTPEECQELAARFGRTHALLAEKVETAAQYQLGKKWGYRLFQGHFFARPVVLTGRTLTGLKQHYLFILAEIQKPELNFQRLEALLKQDVALIYNLLRYVNSAVFNLPQSVGSLRHCLVLLGQERVRALLSMIALLDIARDKPTELIRQAMTRARFYELLAPLMALESRQSDLFLLGLFSLLDAMLDRPLADALRGIPLAPDVMAALLAGAGKLGLLHQLAPAAERADWSALESCARSLKVALTDASRCWQQAGLWADAVLRA